MSATGSWNVPDPRQLRPFRQLVLPACRGPL